MTPRFTREPAQNEVARIAYSLWEEEGRPEGKEMIHWLSALAHVSTDESHQSSEAPQPSIKNGKKKQVVQ